MSAYALPSLFFRDGPAISSTPRKDGAGAPTGASDDDDDSISISSMPEARDDDSVGYGNLFGTDLMKVVLPNRATAMTTGCGATPASSPSTSRSPSPSSPPSSPDPTPSSASLSIAIKSVTLNAHLLASSPRSVIRRASNGGSGGLSSPRNHSRNCGNNPGLSDAIEVVLSVSQPDGRAYPATRTLARILELSIDLNAEHNRPPHDYSAGGRASFFATVENNKVIVAPPLPPEVVSASLGQSGSFTHLCGRLDTVRDLLTDWFERLLTAMGTEDSLALSSFLWEPVWLTDGGAAGIGGGGSGGMAPPHGSSSSRSSGGTIDGSSRPSAGMPGSSGGDGGIPLAFARRRRSSVVRRSSMESVSTLGSIHENDMIFF